MYNRKYDRNSKNVKYENNNNFNYILGMFRKYREWDFEIYNDILISLYRNLLKDEDYWEDIFDLYYEFCENE